MLPVYWRSSFGRNWHWSDVLPHRANCQGCNGASVTYWDLGEAVPSSKGCCVTTILDAKLGKDGDGVGLDCARADVELLSDLFVCQVLAEKTKHVQFPRAEPKCAGR